MNHKFKVTGLGLKVDGVMIMPGSEVTLSAKAPSHWSRFGEPSIGQGKAERKLEVATPEPSQQTEQPKRRGRPPRQEAEE